ncbi:hypothetical protein [Mobilicoccus massiliensis]|uniref:hypothetical protein n=1 Tax=Mobilicoccus massiliensis TaxID=1522310 RepID=UPI00058E2E2A|nr:hypothetical protein [Mobilicoccus massiliensis]
MSEIVSTRFAVRGVHSDDDVRKALQALFDIFADEGLGQATFELAGGPTADLVVKHQASVVPDRDAIDAALARAGDYRLAG